MAKKLGEKKKVTLVYFYGECKPHYYFGQNFGDIYKVEEPYPMTQQFYF